jgi:hypothetical protein
MFARQVLYNLSHAPSPFSFSYFSDSVLYFLPRLASDPEPPTDASCIARIRDCTTTPSLFVEMGSC